MCRENGVNRMPHSQTSGPFLLRSLSFHHVRGRVPHPCVFFPVRRGKQTQRYVIRLDVSLPGRGQRPSPSSLVFTAFFLFSFFFVDPCWTRKTGDRHPYPNSPSPGCDSDTKGPRDSPPRGGPLGGSSSGGFNDGRRSRFTTLVSLAAGPGKRGPKWEIVLFCLGSDDSSQCVDDSLGRYGPGGESVCVKGREQHVCYGRNPGSTETLVIFIFFPRLRWSRGRPSVRPPLRGSVESTTVESCFRVAVGLGGRVREGEKKGRWWGKGGGGPVNLLPPPFGRNPTSTHPSLERLPDSSSTLPDSLLTCPDAGESLEAYPGLGPGRDWRPASDGCRPVVWKELLLRSTS